MRLLLVGSLLALSVGVQVSLAADEPVPEKPTPAVEASKTEAPQPVQPPSSQPSTVQVLSPMAAPVENTARTAAPKGPLDETKAFLTLRDPFRRLPETKSNAMKRGSELESFSVDQFRLIAVMTGPTRVKAMVRAPDGKTHVIARNTVVGLRKGAVTQIMEDRVIVVEKITNILGELENVETELLLSPDGR